MSARAPSCVALLLAVRALVSRYLTDQNAKLRWLFHYLVAPPGEGATSLIIKKIKDIRKKVQSYSLVEHKGSLACSHIDWGEMNETLNRENRKEQKRKEKYPAHLLTFRCQPIFTFRVFGPYSWCSFAGRVLDKNNHDNLTLWHTARLVPFHESCYFNVSVCCIFLFQPKERRSEKKIRSGPWERQMFTNGDMSDRSHPTILSDVFKHLLKNSSFLHP